MGSYFNHSWLLKSYPTHNKPLSFYFYVYLRDLSHEETLVGLMPWGEPPIFIHSHNPMEERKREVVYVYGGSGASGFPLGSREHPWVPLPHERTHSYESLYYNKVMVASKP